MSDIFEQLRAPFPVEAISWRVGATNAKSNNGKATKGIALAYLDARDVMQRLDDVVGPQNWQSIHPHANGKTSCRIGIKSGDEWVWKENGAGDSDTEAEKGAFSDSFKRAAVLWGIGRYLYNVPNVWVELDDYKQIKDPKDKKLVSALRSAEQGIRLTEEPEVKPFSSDEYTALINEIKTSATLEDLNEARLKANSAKPRMIDKERNKELRDAIANREKFLINSPIGKRQQAAEYIAEAAE